MAYTPQVWLRALKVFFANGQTWPVSIRDTIDVKRAQAVIEVQLSDGMAVAAGNSALITGSSILIGAETISYVLGVRADSAHAYNVKVQWMALDGTYLSNAETIAETTTSFANSGPFPVKGSQAIFTITNNDSVDHTYKVYLYRVTE